VKRLFTGFRPRRHLVLVLALLALLALFLSGCDTDTPQNTFDTKGEVAEKQADIFYLSMWPAIAIMILVLGGLVVIMLRFRERDPEHIPPQIHGNTRLELAWTIAPAILLLAIGIPMVAIIWDLGREPSEPSVSLGSSSIRSTRTLTAPLCPSLIRADFTFRPAAKWRSIWNR
jgi:cytochrome c oxidase subunit 2